LGRRLLIHISDLMHSGDDIPSVSASATVTEAIVEMTRKRLGMTTVLDEQGAVLGVYTDGDLRRTLEQGRDPHSTPVSQVMTRTGHSIGPDALAIEAVELMQTHKIQGLLVLDESGRLAGVLNFHDLLQAGVV
jgi:arabinose-5-phosphate isomerase